MLGSEQECSEEQGLEMGVEIVDTSKVYYISTPYLNLYPFQSIDTPSHNPDRGLYDIYNLIRHCFDTYYWHPPTSEENMYSSIISRFMDRVKQTNVYPAKLGTILSNYKHNDFEVESLLAEHASTEPEACKCRSYINHLPPEMQEQYIDRYTRHIRTDKCSFYTAAGHPILSKIATEGRNCRLLARPSVVRLALRTTWGALAEALRLYIMTDSPTIPDHMRSYIFSALSAQLCWYRDWHVYTELRYYCRVYSTIFDGMSQASLTKALRDIHTVYTITVCDKAVERSVIECTLHYRMMVHSRLSSNEMKLVATSRPEIDSLVEQAKTQMYSIIPESKIMANDGCAVYWLSTKIIKITQEGKTDQEKASIDMYRCISDTVQSVVEPWSQALAIIGSKLTTEYYEVCLQKALRLWESGRCPASWSSPKVKFHFQMKDTAEIVKNQAAVRSICCQKADMKKFFEKPLQIPEDGSDINILSSNLYIWDRVMHDGPRPYRCVHVNMRTRTARLIACRHKQPYNPDSEIVCIDRQLYETMHRYVFKYTYVRFGDQAYNQTLGTPMGVAVSVNNSHNFLSRFDELHMDFLVEHRLFAEAARWWLFYRAVDDMYSANNPTFAEDMARWGRLGEDSVWDYLSYEVETVAFADDDPTIGIEANMCDITIHIDRARGTFSHALYDKTHHLGELSKRLPRYPNAHSQITPSIKKGVIISQLSRIYTKSSSQQAFLRDSLRMILRHAFNGIQSRCIRAAILQWKPRSTCHLTWKATYTHTTRRLFRCLNHHDRLYHGRADAYEISQGVFNPALQNYILELLRLG